MKNKAEIIAEWVEGLSYDDIPERIIERAKYQLLSTLAAAYAGSVSTGGRIMLDTIKDLSACLPERERSQSGNAQAGRNGGGRCTIIPAGIRTSLIHAILANLSFSMAYDFDDYLFMGHPCHSAVLGTLALSEELNKGGKDFLAAQVIGNEVGGRLGASVLLGPQNGQAWSYIHTIGTACLGAKLLGLSREQIINAIGISMYQPNYPLFPGFMGPHSKLLTASFPAVNGAVAALLAEKGFTGSPEILDHPQGFLTHFSFIPFKDMLSGFGRSWVMDTIAFKKYPGCAYIDSAIDATLSVMDKFESERGRKLDPGEIEDIKVSASVMTVAMTELWRKFYRDGRLEAVDANFSIPLSVAITIIAGRLTPLELGDDFLNRFKGDILSLGERVLLEHDWSMTFKLIDSLKDMLDFGSMLKDIKIRKLAHARREIRNTVSGMSLGFNEILSIFQNTTRAQRRSVRQLIGSALYKRVFGGSKVEFDLGDVNFQEMRMPFSAKVRILTKGGEEFEAAQEIPWGAPGRRWEETSTLVREKFLQEAGAHMGKGRAGEVLKMVEGLEGLDRVGELVEVCCKKK